VKTVGRREKEEIMTRTYRQDRKRLVQESYQDEESRKNKIVDKKKRNITQRTRDKMSGM